MNRYTYVFNNPLRYTDPTGQFGWGDIKNAINTTITVVQNGLQVAETKVVETYYQIGVTVETGKSIISQTVGNALDNAAGSIGKGGLAVEQAINNLPNTVTNDIGVEGISHINTSSAQDIPVIDVKQGSLLDRVLPEIVTIYPFGIFSNDPMKPSIQEEEGYHWNDQSNWGPFVPLWYAEYAEEYGYYYIAYGGKAGLAHDAVSFEQSAMGYAGTGSPPPPPFWYWWYYYVGANPTNP